MSESRAGRRPGFAKEAALCSKSAIQDAESGDLPACCVRPKAFYWQAYFLPFSGLGCNAPGYVPGLWVN